MALNGFEIQIVKRNLMSEDLRIVLVGAAKAAHDLMLAEVKDDARTSINSSKLINWLVQDYFKRFYIKRKKALIKDHLNSKKWILEVMKTGNATEIRRALHETARHFKSNEENIDKNDSSQDASDTLQKLK